MRTDGTWLALGAAGVLAAAAGVRRGSVNELPGPWVPVTDIVEWK